MASKKISGITIEIDGNTTKLGEALKSVDSQINSVNSELKQINNSLKFNPGNMDLLSQKSIVLKNAIAETNEKLATLKKAQQDMKAKGIDENSDAYRELEREILKTENQLKSYKKQQDSIKAPNLDKVAESFKKVGKVCADVAKEVAKVSSAIAVGLGTIVAKGIQSSAELEQQIGGTVAVFGQYSKKVQEYAKKASNSAGLSANAYMSYANKIGSLMKGSGIETQKAVELTSEAMTRAADVASIMGISVESAMEAITGAAKGNFTMMDNLGVAMNATNLQAYALSKGIETSYNKMTQAQKVGLAYQMFLEKTSEYSGNYAKENETLSGSFNTLKVSFENFIAGVGDTEQLIENVVSFGKILGDRLIELAPTLLNGIVTLVENLIPQIASLLMTIVPQLFNAVKNLFNKLLNMVTTNLQPGMKFVSELASEIIKSIPLVIPAITDVFLQIVETFSENYSLLLNVSREMILSLTQGLFNALPLLLQKLPVIISNIAYEIGKPESLAKMIQVGVEIISAIIKGLIKALPELLLYPARFMKNIFDKFKESISGINWASLGKNILDGILNGMMDFGNVVKNSVKKVGNKITSEIKAFFGIKSPSRLMKKEVGRFLAMGISEGFEDEIPNTIDDVQSAMSELNKGIQASVNPVINPQANSNPLIIQIENFNNSRETDIQALAEELEFYRKMSATANGGN